MAELSLPSEDYLLKYHAQYVCNLTAGQKLKIEIGPDDYLDLTVPAGKVWDGIVVVAITEDDA